MDSVRIAGRAALSMAAVGACDEPTDAVGDSVGDSVRARDDHLRGQLQRLQIRRRRRLGATSECAAGVLDQLALPSGDLVGLQPNRPVRSVSVLSSRSTVRAICALKAGGRVHRAFFLTLETPVAKPSSARLHAGSFHLKAPLRFPGPLRFILWPAINPQPGLSLCR